jgi:hypothetical protein
MALDIKTQIIVVLAVVVLVYLLSSIFQITPVSGECGLMCIAGTGVKEPFLGSSPANFEGERLKTEKKMYPLNDKLVYTPQGTPNNLRPTDTVPAVYPASDLSVDGTKKSPTSLFMFANNQCRPDCCPSTYSCGGGCVCVTQEQMNYISNRGNNNTGVQSFTGI